MTDHSVQRPHDGKAGKNEELQGLHNSSEIAPPAKEIRNKKISLVST